MKTAPGVSTRPILKTGKQYFRESFRLFAHKYPKNEFRPGTADSFLHPAETDTLHAVIFSIILLKALGDSQVSPVFEQTDEKPDRQSAMPAHSRNAYEYFRPV